VPEACLQLAGRVPDGHQAGERELYVTASAPSGKH